MNILGKCLRLTMEFDSLRLILIFRRATAEDTVAYSEKLRSSGPYLVRFATDVGYRRRAADWAVYKALVNCGVDLSPST